MKKLFFILSIFSTASLLFTVVLLFYWQFRPYKILEFKEGNAVIENTQVYAGDYLKMRQRNCKYKDLQSTINRQFVDTIIYTVPPSYTKRPLGCNDIYEYVYIPKAIPPGKYYILTTISYQVNPIRQVSYTVKTNDFYILDDTIGGL